ncbi:MAG: response regulator, partial [Planctomycetota bacterium]
AKVPSESPIADRVRAIEHASQRAAELCRQLLAYAGKGRFVLQPVDLSRMVEETARHLGPRFPAAVEVRLSLDPGLPAVEGDPAQLRPAVASLLQNAVESHGGKPGLVIVSTSLVAAERTLLARATLGEALPAGDYVALEVADNGCGMDARTQARIFDPFFTTKFSGRGLGLAAVQGVVRGHGGALFVRSAPGKGAHFRILLPPSPRSVPAPEPVADDHELWRGRGTVLVVDDERIVRDVAGRILKEAGYEVLAAEDGATGIELLRRHGASVSCVLLDLTMPGMNGEQVCKEMRRLQPGLPVVLSSGYGETELLERMEGGTPDAFLRKPYTVEALTATLRKVLGGG